MAALRAIFVVVALLVSSPAWGQGGPPLFTDDPGTPGPGRWEVNTAFTLVHSSGVSEFGAPLLDVNYGWGERIQLKLEIPWVFLRRDGEGTESGLGNPLFGVKWRFLDEDRAGVAVSTYPQIGFNVVSSSVDAGVADRETSVLIPVSAVKSLGPIEVNVQVGRLFESDGGFWQWGIAVGHDFGRVEALAEIFATHGSASETRQTRFNLGGRWRMREHATLLVSAGTSVYDAEGPRHSFVYLGLQFTTGSEKKNAP
jgi:hypothetical protein